MPMCIECVARNRCPQYRIRLSAFRAIMCEGGWVDIGQRFSIEKGSGHEFTRVRKMESLGCCGLRDGGSCHVRFAASGQRDATECR